MAKDPTEQGGSGGDRQAGSSYDQVPYPSRAIEDTHPDCQATVARLFGLSPPEIARCRVLEIGCARGDNLMAMAMTLPEASLLGVDASARQIADGRRRLAATGLANVELRHCDLLDLGSDLGEFDYIICHGVYSWVPRRVADRILALCDRHLAPEGVAYISYNTYPGWRTNAMLREMMQYHVRGLTDPQEKTAKARDFVRFLARFAREEQGTYRAVFEKLARLLDGAPDYYFFHEYFEEDNEPLYFAEFAERAAATGLRYLGPAQFIAWHYNLPPGLEEMLAGLPDRVAREQYLDFLDNRTFRRSLLCHQNLAVLAEPSAQVVPALKVSARAKPARLEPDIMSNEPEEFVTPTDERLTTSRPLVKATLAVLADSAPRWLAFETLWKEARERLHAAEPGVTEVDLANVLLRAAACGLLDLSGTPPPFAAVVPDRPVASPLARIQAAEDEYVTNLRHRNVKLEDLDRFLLRRLDGSRNQAALSEALATAIESGDYVLNDPAGEPVRDPKIVREYAEAEVWPCLSRLAGSCLLMA